jgi:hypothetical protein
MFVPFAVYWGDRDKRDFYPHAYFDKGLHLRSHITYQNRIRTG